MANSNVLIAGTGGISLMDSQGNDLGYPAQMALGSLTHGLIGYTSNQLIELLSMDHESGQIQPTRTSLKPGLSIGPGHVIESAYNQVPSDFYRFLYDWRADMRWSAAALKDFIVRKPPGGRWNIVAHSQGGLLVVLASKLFGNTTDFANYVASVTFVGTPLLGTINAAHAILDGDLFSPSTNDAFQQIVRTWPSIYQMCPDDTWQDPVVDSAGASISGQALIALLPGANGDMRSRWVAARQMLKNPFQYLEGDVQVLIIMARTRPTAVNLELIGNSLTSRSWTFETGDTLVPWKRTMTCLGSASQFVRTLLGPINEHAFLFTDPTVWGEVGSALRQ